MLNQKVKGFFQVLGGVLAIIGMCALGVLVQIILIYCLTHLGSSGL